MCEEYCAPFTRTGSNVTKHQQDKQLHVQKPQHLKQETPPALHLMKSHEVTILDIFVLKKKRPKLDLQDLSTAAKQQPTTQQPQPWKAQR